MKKLLIIAICLLFSCKHSKNGEIVRDKNGVYYILHDEDGLMPHEAYRFTEVDTTKFKIVNFK